MGYKAISNGVQSGEPLIAKEGRIIMKRLVMLAVLCAFVFGMAATASAADIKATGKYTFEFIWSDMDFQDNDDNSNFDVYQRLRTKFEFIANENLKGVLYTEVGTTRWGQEARVGSNVENANAQGAVEIKAGYIDFNWPGTEQNIKVGHFGVAFPSAVGVSSIIQDDESPAVMVSGPITDNVSYMASWIRADRGADEQNDYMDVIAAALPLTFDGVVLKPFFAYGYAGSGYTATDATGGISGGLGAPNATATDELESAWWAGVAFELTMFDPFVFKADLSYGDLDSEEESADMSGWYAAASLAYTGWDMVQPELFFAYTSGEDGNGTDDLESERMPILSNDWALGSFFFGGDWALEGAIDAESSGAGMGFWVLGLSLKDFSFFEGLKHTVHVLYAQGTNDESILDAGYKNDGSTSIQFGKTLLEDDSIFEIDLNTEYAIYDELTAYVELGWISADWDDAWDDAGVDTEDDAYKVSMGLNYAF